LARAPRLLLHAQVLALQHPVTHQDLRWTCEPDW
jgi:23S rRNA-/tRNA-specific pseudouridylate synthase